METTWLSDDDTEQPRRRDPREGHAGDLTTPEEVELWLSGPWEAVKHLQRQLSETFWSSSHHLQHLRSKEHCCYGAQARTREKLSPASMFTPCF